MESLKCDDILWGIYKALQLLKLQVFFKVLFVSFLPKQYLASIQVSSVTGVTERMKTFSVLLDLLKEEERKKVILLQ